MFNCVKHGLVKPRKRSDSKSVRCSKCVDEKTAEQRRVLKAKALEYKGNKCEKCGYSKSRWSLSFHHKNPNEKDFNFSSYVKGWSKIKTELDKCILVCNNCHGEIHEQLFNLGL